MTAPGSHASALERLSDYLDGLPVRAYADGACTPVADLAIITRALDAIPMAGALTAWAARHDLVGTGWHATVLADLHATVTALLDAERARCAAAICQGCAEGLAIETGVFGGQDQWWHPGHQACAAAALRQAPRGKR